jgi:hypothetical protein
MARVRYMEDEILALFVRTDAPPMPGVPDWLISRTPISPFTDFRLPRARIMQLLPFPRRAAPISDFVPERSAPPIVAPGASRRIASLEKADPPGPERHWQPPAPASSLPKKLSLPMGEFPPSPLPSCTGSEDEIEVATDGEDARWQPLLPKPLPFALLARQPVAVLHC